MSVTLYKVVSREIILPSNPLHVSHFYQKQRIHTKNMRDRQDLILYLANLHATASRQPRGFNSIQLRLTNLRDWVPDYRVVLDQFFTVQTLGFHIDADRFEVSTLIPKVDVPGFAQEASEKARELYYVPPPRPLDTETLSKVFIQLQNGPFILQRLAETNRHDLVAPVKWLLAQPGGEVNFHFARSGKLQLRDTSIWPIRGIETWPGWLREALVGPGVDIDSAYTQFLFHGLQDVYSERLGSMELLYPDLIQSLNEKQAWREGLCNDLGISPTSDNLRQVKSLCMSLANGSKISGSILQKSRAFSESAELVFNLIPDKSDENLARIGRRLSSISKQFQTAKTALCSNLKLNPSRQNSKLIFASYFDWEREARYRIWNAVGRCGLMVHDGIDGIPAEMQDSIPKIMDELQLKLS